MTSKSIDNFYNFNIKVVDFRGNVAGDTKLRLNFPTTSNGNPVPGWSEKIKHQQDASSDYSLTRYKVSMGSYKASYSCSVGRETVDDTYYPNYPFVWPEPEALSSKVYNTALGNFLSNAREVVSPFQGLTFLAELKETLQMIRNPATALRNGIGSYLKAVRHRRRHFRGDAKNFFRTLSGTWLEYAYGWKPILNDIESACNAYAQHEADVQFLRAYGKAESQSGLLNQATHKLYFANYGSYIRRLAHQGSQKVVFKGVVRVNPEIQANVARNVARLSGFDLASFVPTAWEVIPYSFVVDMFSNIGTILNSAIALYYNWVWWSCASTRSMRSDITIEPGVKSPWTWAWSESIAPGSIEKVSYVRSKPVLSLPVPQLELPGSNWTWANLLALASQLTLSKV